MEYNYIEIKGFRIPLLYEDNHLLVVVKPPNLPTQADDSKDADLLNLLKTYIAEKYNKPGKAYLGLVHRLDRPVGGVMVFARTSKAASRLCADFASHTQDRRYLAVLEGEMRKERALRDFLLKDPRSGMVRCVNAQTPGAKEARLVSRPLKSDNGLTLSEVQLFTGRAHQIRVQHAHAGLALWGDNRYGRGKPGQQIALWAYLLKLEHPVTHKSLEFCAPPPDSGIWRRFKSDIERLCFQAEDEAP